MVLILNKLPTNLDMMEVYIFSNDGKKLVFRSSRPKTEKEIKEYKDTF